MYDQMNVSHLPHTVSTIPEAAPEPTPHWVDARATWKWGWYLHNYGFGVAFALLALYAVRNVLAFRRRLKVQQYLLVINAILLLLGASRATYLLVDPYESSGVLPGAVSRVCYGVTYPCLTSSFNLIQMVFMRITRVHMGPNKLHNYRLLAAIITSHFTIVIVIDVTVAYRNNFKLLLLLAQSIFITWGLILCFGFVYGGFKMSQFTQETQKVLKQLATYQRVKLETQRAGNRRDLALHRISKPKIRLTEDEHGTQSYYSDTSQQDSSDSLSFFNEAPLEFDEDLIARACLARFGEGIADEKQREIQYARGGSLPRRHCTYRPQKSGNQLQALQRGSSQADLSSDSEYVTDTPSPSTVVTPNDDITSGDITREDTKTSAADLFEDVELGMSKNCSESNIFTIESELNGFVNPALQIKSSDSRTGKPNSNGFVSRSGFPMYCDSLTGVESKPAEEAQVENGYMADTELNSPKRRRKRGKSKHKEHVEEDDEEQDTGSPGHHPYSLPVSEGTVSLYRIRQGRMLHKALQVSYLTTLLGFLTCILQLYAMFGVYGVLSTETHAEPWPWFIFHTIFR